MKSLNVLKKESSYIFLIILCFYPLMSFPLMSKTIICFLLLSILTYYKNFTKNLKKLTIKPLLINSGFYVLMILTLLYSNNTNTGLKELQQTIPFLLFPIVFFYFQPKFSKKRFNYVILSFVISNFIFLLRAYNFFIFRLSELKTFSFKDKSYIEKVFLICKTSFVKITSNAINVKNNPPDFFFHKAYISMIFLLAICMAIYLLFYTKWNYWVKSVLVFIALLLSFSIFHFFSIPNLLAFILVIPLLLYFNIKSKLKNYVSLFLIVIIPLTIYNSDFITNKLIANKNIAQLKRFVKDPISFSPELGEQKSRSMINFCSLELIKTAPFIGYGIGDAKDELITCYEDSDFIEGVLYEYNSHNYYLKLIISGGIILFLSFLYLLISNFVIAIKLEKWLYISFIVIIGVNLLSENILGRAHGILFFALFNSLFYKKHLLYTSKK